MVNYSNNKKMENALMRRYLIKDVIKILNISRKTLYLWEEKKKIPKAKRDPMSRYRYWDKNDIDKLKKITGR